MFEYVQTFTAYFETANYKLAGVQGIRMKLSSPSRFIEDLARSQYSIPLFSPAWILKNYPDEHLASQEKETSYILRKRLAEISA